MSALKNWLEKHATCKDGVKWALDTGCATIEEIWLRDDLRPEWRVWVATRKGMVSDRILCKFACACARQVWDLLTDERSRNAVEVAERFVDGNATKKELTATCAAALDAANAVASNNPFSAASGAAHAAANAAACGVARPLKWGVIMVSSISVAGDIAYATARAAVRAADSETVWEAQAKILLELLPRLEEQQ